MKQAEEERNKLATFSARMEELDKKYKFSVEKREIVAKDIRDLDEENYKAYVAKLDILLKSEFKASENTTSNEGDKSQEVDKKNESTSQTVVADVIDNGKKDKTEVPNTTSVSPSLKERAARAFSVDEGFTIEFGVQRRK